MHKINNYYKLKCELFCCYLTRVEKAILPITNVLAYCSI
jgi:hypothetical protein